MTGAPASPSSDCAPLTSTQSSSRLADTIWTGLGGSHEHLHITTEQFDAVAMKIEATLNFLGVPKPETMEFMAVIEGYRHEVVQPAPAPAPA